MNERDNGYRGIWYANQPQGDAYHYKYSGGFATYPQQIIPHAIYAPAANRTYFCYGGRPAQRNTVLDMVSFYDHTTGLVPRPTIVLARQTDDSHYNPTLALDQAGYVYVFCNSHGQGYELGQDDPTFGKAFIYRSAAPYSTDSFVCLRSDNFSYSQVWETAGAGLVWLHTRYAGNERRLFCAHSGNGQTWSAPQQLTHMGKGNYQISWANGRRVAAAFDYHPLPVGLNARTNMYYMQTDDGGATWQTVDGQPISLPLTQAHNPALVHDYEAEGLLVYLKDLTFDESGRPVILYLTSKGHESGPANDPRLWRIAHWTGRQWERHIMLQSDHNYDHGSLYIEPGGKWRLIAPTAPGPQPYGTGGQVVVWRSSDQGQTWTQEQTLPCPDGRNHTYVRRPVNAHPGFYAFWADGDAFAPSDSSLFFCTREGSVFRLPARMEGDWAAPARV